MTYHFIEAQYVSLIHRDFDICTIYRFPVTSSIHTFNSWIDHLTILMVFCLTSRMSEIFVIIQNRGGVGGGGGAEGNASGRENGKRERPNARRYSGFGANARNTANGTLVRYPRFPSVLSIVFADRIRAPFAEKMLCSVSIPSSSFYASPCLPFQFPFIFDETPPILVHDDSVCAVVLLAFSYVTQRAWN